VEHTGGISAFWSIYRFEGNRIFIRFPKCVMMTFSLTLTTGVWSGVIECRCPHVHLIAVAHDGVLQLSQTVEDMSLLSVLLQSSTPSTTLILGNTCTKHTWIRCCRFSGVRWLCWRASSTHSAAYNKTERYTNELLEMQATRYTVSEYLSSTQTLQAHNSSFMMSTHI